MRIFVITGVGRENSLGTKIAKAIKETCDDAIIFGIVHPDETTIPSVCDFVSVCDLNDLDEVESLFTSIAEQYTKIYCVINCAGMNENVWFEDIDFYQYEKIVRVNSTATAVIAKSLLPSLEKAGGTILSIVSNASHMPLRCSLAYNASKAAALMIMKQLSKELTKKNGITIFSISPNKLSATGMTENIDAQVPKVRGWTREHSDEYQDSLLMVGEKTCPDVLARFVAYLLSNKQNHFYLSGCDMPYGV